MVEQGESEIKGLFASVSRIWSEITWGRIRLIEDDGAVGCRVVLSLSHTSAKHDSQIPP